MESIQPEVLRSAIKEVWIRALTEVQPDVLNALVKARAEETNPRGQQYLDILIENAKKAKENRIVICQDTGVPTFFVKTSLSFPFTGDIRAEFDGALRDLTKRNSLCGPWSYIL